LRGLLPSSYNLAISGFSIVHGNVGVLLQYDAAHPNDKRKSALKLKKNTTFNRRKAVCMVEKGGAKGYQQ
jgi:hypothetical protein